MKKLTIILLAILVIFAVNAIAADSILETTIDSMVVAMTKNNAEYVRFIITEPRTLDGVNYPKSLPLMAFGPLVEEAKTYKAGDAIKCVANFRKLDDGRESYTILSFIQ